MKRISLTAIGKDRPGIVAGVAKVLYEHGCNIEDSTMTILEDEFAIILIMSAPEEMDKDSLEQGLKRAGEELALTIHTKEIGKESPEKAPHSTHLVTVSGYDKPGIVHKTACLLAKWNVNITDLSTKVIHGEGKDAYIMLIEVFVPGDADEKTIAAALKTLSKGLGVKIEMKPVETYESL
ncbi:MAG: transcriptional regulator [Deltaproteobacteria bacterium]|nr:transcriptional regulator [Deltaproteobacteria bacterium]